MKITHEERDQLTVMSLRGDLVGEEANRFRRAAIERMDDDTRDFVVDLSEMERIDSQGLEALLWLQDRAAERLGQVRLAACSEPMQRILTMTRLAPRLEAHDTADAAAASLF